jgi:acetyl coenzyme A synthetase (ADP forming)-like protein
MLPRDLTSFLFPKSVAVVGASRSPEKVGAVVLKNIIESKFTGTIYPVNPNTRNIGELQCFPDIRSLPEAVDLVLVAVPAALVADTLNQIGEKKIKNVVVFSAGYKETGTEGEKMEEELVKTAKKYDLNLLGPNCMGFVNNLCPINASFGQTVNLPGNLRFVSQSGAIAASMLDWCQSVGLGFSQFVTLGNKAVLGENDFLLYFQNCAKDLPANDEGLSAVHPIALYLESISDGPEFVKMTTQLGKTEPIFIIKPGKTPAAAKAMQSHTGAIAGEDDILDAALKQAGVIRCQSMEDFFDLARGFAWEEAPVGRKVAIVSNAGGAGVISADAVAASGLMLAQFDEQTREKLMQVLPRSASILNPVDVLGDALAQRYADASRIILETNLADSLLIILTPQMMTQVENTARVIGELSRKYKKPIFCSFIGGGLVYEGEQILNQSKIPSFRFPERAISAIGAMCGWQEQKSQPAVTVTAESQEAGDRERIKKVIGEVLKTSSRSLDSLQANEVVSALGIATPATMAVENVEQAKTFAGQNGWPVVLKLVSPGMLHKAALGGVVANIWNEGELELAWDRLSHKIAELPSQAKEGLRYQIQKDVTSGIEVIVGIKMDPTFGPVLLFGAGGQLAELVADKNLKILPINIGQAEELVGNSKVYKLLRDRPGEPPYALDKLYKLIVKLTGIIPLVPEATDIEINPVIITANDVWAVDCKMLLAGGAAPTTVERKFHTATVTSNTILASQFHYLEIEADGEFKYQPGQYVSVKVAPERINSYSIAGGSGRKFHLLIDTSPGGPGSKFFENIKPGDRMAFLGPFGTFTLKKDDGAKKLLFLGTGSGCSPLRAILEAALKHPDIKLPVNFYFGLRYTGDVFWREYFQKLSQDFPNLHFNLVLSKPDESWHGQVGHITDALGQEVPDASDCSAYLCGNQKMIEEATNMLLAHNCPKDRIYTEKF